MPPHPTLADRISPTELQVTRLFDAPPHLVFAAWTTPALLMRWWAPKSFGITMLSCQVDARTGGSYRFEFGHPSFEKPMAFFGRYLEVIPNAKLVWTNEEGHDGQISTVTFQDMGGRTRLVLHDLYPSAQALDEAMESGSNGAWGEQFTALDAMLSES